MLEDGAGEELLQELRGAGKSLPTVLMSASTKAPRVAQSFGAELLLEPFDIETMLERMKNAIARAESKS